jgi:hypothetical protein
MGTLGAKRNLMTTENIERATKVVQHWYRGPYNIHGFDETDPARQIEISDIAAALDAAELRERDRIKVIGEKLLQNQLAAADKMGDLDFTELYHAYCWQIKKFMLAIDDPKWTME